MPATGKPKLPILVICDVDYTMIADMAPIGDALDLNKFVRHAIQSKKITDVSCPKKMNYTDFMVPRYIRPGLKELFAGIKKHFPTAEFFVYSAGTKDYIENVIPAIEKEIDVTFRRPLFSRPDCVYDGRRFTKSIQGQMDKIVSSLLSDYPALKNDKSIDTLLKYRTFFLDDSDVVWDMPSKWIQCPTYSFIPVIDLTKYLDVAICRHPLVKEAIHNTKYFFEEPTDSSISEYERNLMYHTYMASMYSTNLEVAKESMEDKFCMTLLKAIKSFKNLKYPFTDKNIEKIQKQINT